MEIRQAITTKFLGPTAQKGSRISVRCEAGRIIVDYDHSISNEQNYIRAAHTLFNKLDWNEPTNYGKKNNVSPKLAGGIDSFGNYIFVIIHVNNAQEIKDETKNDKR